MKHQNTKQTSFWILQQKEMIPGFCFTGKSLQVMEGGAAFNDGRISVGDRLVVVKNRQTNKQTLIFSIFQAGRRQEPAHWRLLLGQLHS